MKPKLLFCIFCRNRSRVLLQRKEHDVRHLRAQVQGEEGRLDAQAEQARGPGARVRPASLLVPRVQQAVPPRGLLQQARQHAQPGRQGVRVRVVRLLGDGQADAQVPREAGPRGRAEGGRRRGGQFSGGRGGEAGFRW